MTWVEMEPGYLDYLSPWLRGFCSGISNKSNRPDNCLRFSLLLSHFVCHGFIVNVSCGWQVLYAKSVLWRDARAPLSLYIVQLDTLGAPMAVRARFFCLFFPESQQQTRPDKPSSQFQWQRASRTPVTFCFVCGCLHDTCILGFLSGGRHERTKRKLKILECQVVSCNFSHFLSQIL
jgi:hypothetical protein